MLGILNFGRRQQQRNLASALIGEVTATLEAIEGYDEVRRLEAGDDQAEKCLSELESFRTPSSPIYIGNVGRLNVFDAPLQRQVTYFYTRIASLADHLHALSRSTEDEALRKQHARDAAAEINNAMNAGDDLLRTLRPLVSRRRKPSLTRA